MYSRTANIQLSLIGILLLLLIGIASAKPAVPPIDYYAEEKAKQGYLLAMELYNHQLYQEAISEAVKIITLYPNTTKVPDTLYLIGTIDADTSNPANNQQLAIKIWQQLVDRFPKYPQSATVLMQIAEKWEAMNEWQKAIQVYDRVLAQYAKSEFADDALFWSARAEYQLVRYPESKRKCEMIIKNYPEATDDGMKVKGRLIDDTLMMLAEVSIAQQDTTTAVTVLEQVITKYPESPYFPVALFQLGKIYQETYFQSTLACSYYQRIIEYIPDPTWQRLAKLKVEQCLKNSP